MLSQHLLSSVQSAILRRPQATLVWCLVAAGVAAWLATSVEFRTSRAELAPPDDPDQRRWDELLLEYAGSESCKDCHGEAFESWKQTGMARMFQPYQPENVFGDFTDQNEFPATGDFVQARMGVEPGRHYFEFRDDEGSWRRYDVHYTIGSKWQQAYATRLRDGRIHVFPIQYSKIHGKWSNFWKVIDPPGSERADLQAFYRLTSSTSYQLNCAMCHMPNGPTPVNMDFRFERTRAQLNAINVRPTTGSLGIADAYRIRSGDKDRSMVWHRMGLRTFQIRFLECVGLRPKEFARILRLQATLRGLDRGEESLAQLALGSGFSDQAHATRELHHLTGVTPARLRRALRGDRDADQTIQLAAAFVRGHG